MTRLTHEMRATAAAHAVAFITAAGHPELLDALRIEWSTSARSRLGAAIFGGPRNTVAPAQRCIVPATLCRIIAIRLTARLWPHASERDRRQCVGHEVAHLVDSWRAYRDAAMRGPSHGPTWQRVMRELGLPVERCHRVVVEGVNRVGGFRCGCGPCTLSPGRAAKARRLARRDPLRAAYRCLVCKQPVLVDHGPQAYPFERRGAA